MAADVRSHGPSDPPTPSPGADPAPAERRAGTSAATKRVLFGQLPSEDASVTVARRLRTAIGLGILADGEKLPKERDLARQLGVTAFSLREALGVLREEGLIHTRVGKGGGSSVRRPAGPGPIAGDELVRMTATELRDLGDWRGSLTTYAAWLAARRAGDSTDVRLRECVDRLATTDDPAVARRALGRFQVELAAGSQSMRLTRAELLVHEEFDWLVQVLLLEDRQRHSVAKLMDAIAAAVRAGNAAEAWEAGERMCSHLSTELMRARLRLIAARQGEPRDTHRQVIDLAAEIRALFGRSIALLEDAARGVATALDPPSGDGAQVEVVRQIELVLGQVDDVIHGLGFMAELDLRSDVRYWVEWWQRSDDGGFDRDYSHELDPQRDAFYDYTTKPYMTSPRASGAPNATGPYVDHGGVDDFIVTVSVPVLDGGRFLGIVAADLRVAGLELVLSPWLAQAEGDCALLDAEGRVLLSNTVRYTVGDVVPRDDELTRTDVGLFGWEIAEAAAARGRSAA